MHWSGHWWFDRVPVCLESHFQKCNSETDIDALHWSGPEHHLILINFVGNSLTVMINMISRICMINMINIATNFSRISRIYRISM